MSSDEKITSWIGIMKELQNAEDLLQKWQDPQLLINDSELRHEESAWERHGREIEVQEAIVDAQKRILVEQKSNTVLTKWILGFTILCALCAVIPYIKVLLRKWF